MASFLDTGREGGWLSGGEMGRLAREEPDRFVARQACNVSERMAHVSEAYAGHPGPRAIVRYEDLMADTTAGVWSVLSKIDAPPEEKELTQAAQKHSWETIPEEKKGALRKATPGSWKDDLTPRQIRIFERFCAPVLREFYSS